MARGGHNFIDLTDQTFGELTALSYNAGTKHNHSTWTCECSCGEKIKVPGYALRAGTYKSCGCKQVSKRDAGVKEHIKQDRVEGTRKSALKAKLHSGNQSGVKGVMWDDNKKRWKAYIGYQGRQVSLGSYLDKDSAIDARKRGEEKYHIKHIHPPIDVTNSRKRTDITGQVFDMLTVIYETTPKGYTRYWLCECECGGYKAVQQAHLKNGKISSCGCKLRKHENLIGQKFNKLTVIAEGKHEKVSGEWRRWWTCKCDCGDTTEVLYSNLKSGATKSCGCQRVGRKDAKGYRVTEEGKYVAYIGVEGETLHLGTFDNEQEAIAARSKAVEDQRRKKR